MKLKRQFVKESVKSWNNKYMTSRQHQSKEVCLCLWNGNNIAQLNETKQAKRWQFQFCKNKKVINLVIAHQLNLVSWKLQMFSELFWPQKSISFVWFMSVMTVVKCINLLEIAEGPGMESNHVEIEAVQGNVFKLCFENSIRYILMIKWWPLNSNLANFQRMLSSFLIGSDEV